MSHCHNAALVHTVETPSIHPSIHFLQLIRGQVTGVPALTPSAWQHPAPLVSTSGCECCRNDRQQAAGGRSTVRLPKQWKHRTWSTRTQCPPPPPGHGWNSPGGRSWGIFLFLSQYIWVCQVLPASSPTIGANSPPDGDWLTAPLLLHPCVGDAGANPRTC